MHNDINDLPNKAISIIKNGDITELSADIIELAFSLDPSVLLKFGIDLKLDKEHENSFVVPFLDL